MNFIPSENLCLSASPPVPKNVVVLNIFVLKGLLHKVGHLSVYSSNVADVLIRSGPDYSTRLN